MNWGSSLRFRLLVAFTVVGLMVVGSAATGLLLNRSAAQTLQAVADVNLPATRTTTRMRFAVDAAAGDLRGYLITGDRRSLAGLGTHWRAYRAAARQAHLACRGAPRGCRLVVEQDALAVQWYDEHAAPVLAGTRSRAHAVARHPAARQLLVRFTVLNERTAAQLDRDVDDDLARAADRRRGGWWSLLISAGLALGGLLLLATVTVRQVVPPLTRLRDALGRLAAGDLAARVEVRGPRELQGVAVGVNHLAEQSQQLRDLETARARTRRSIRGLDRRMRRHLHPDAVAEEVVVGLGPMVGADRVHVRFIDHGRMGPVAAQWSTAGLSDVSPAPPTPSDPLESAPAVAARGAQPVFVLRDGDLLHERGRSVHLLTSSAGDYAAIGSALLMPVLVGTERVGIVVCSRAQGREPFDADQREVIESVGGDLARAVQHARLFEQQNAVVGQLRELDRRKSDFLSTISHELRTPLTSIAGYVEMLRDGDAGPLRPTQDAMLETVSRNTQRLRELIEDVLLISRVEAGTVRTERVPVAISGIVDHVVTALRPQAETAQVGVDVFPIPDDVLVAGDPAQIDRMLLNLLGNALKFTPPRGRVTVSAEVTHDDVVLHVEDTGIGIPADEVPALFTRFFRATNATDRQIPGTGLGLAIIAGIVSAHGGRIEVDSVQDGGTTFTVTLPRWDPAAPGPAPRRP